MNTFALVPERVLPLPGRDEHPRDLTTKHCTVERDGHVVILTMNRPEKNNALSGDMLAGLVLGYEYIDEDARRPLRDPHRRGRPLLVGRRPRRDGPAVRRRQGAGVMARGNNPHWKALLRDYRLSKPLIAAVEGYAVAGGTEILQGTDIRIAGEGAIFGVWEAKRGLFPLGGSACRLPRQIPYTQAMDILLSCRPIPAFEAQQMGLIGRVVPEGTALDVARRRSRQQVAANAPLSTQAILQAWRETEHMSDYDAMQHQDTIGWEVFASAKTRRKGRRPSPRSAHPNTRVAECRKPHPGFPIRQIFATPERARLADVVAAR